MNSYNYDYESVSDNLPEQLFLRAKKGPLEGKETVREERRYKANLIGVMN